MACTAMTFHVARALQICETKLLDAASRGKKEIVKALVKIKANVNCTDQVD